MNRQRKVLITTTYNELGIIIDTKAEEVAQPEPCEDTVSRQRLLSDLKELVAAWKKYPAMAKEIKGVETAIGYVEAIPPAQQERKGKKGKWIKLDMHAHLADHKCTACGQECYVPTCMGEPMYTYCPNCGCRMVDDDDETD